MRIKFGIAPIEIVFSVPNCTFRRDVYILFTIKIKPDFEEISICNSLQQYLPIFRSTRKVHNRDNIGRSSQTLGVAFNQQRSVDNKKLAA